MRRLRSHPLIALLCALCLLGAQQVANAHYVGHLDSASGALAVHKSGGSDEAPALERICATCAAFAALSSAPPSDPAVPSAVGFAAVRPLFFASVFTPAPAAPPYASRAPPAVL
jgi:hypothetical protein